MYRENLRRDQIKRTTEALGKLAEPLLDKGYIVERRLSEPDETPVFMASRNEERITVKAVSWNPYGFGQEYGRFSVERRSLESLSHPGIVPYLGHFTMEGGGLLMLGYIDGESLLQAVTRHGPLHWAEAARIGASVCEALSHMHGNGIIHRDVKPANILLGKDGPVLIDFGLAYIRPSEEDGEDLTKPGTIIGTPLYRAPEQLGSGRGYDERVDIYALGGTLYEALTGEPPFDGDYLEIVMAHMRSTPLPLQVKAPGRGIPEEFNSLLMKALEKHKDGRFSSAKEMRASLLSLLERESQVYPANDNAEGKKEKGAA